MKTAINVLLVEDAADDALLMERELGRAGYQARCVRVDTREGLERALISGTWDVIICDYSLPHFSGTAAFDVVKQTGLDIPFIIVSGTIGEETAVAAMRAGVQDFIMKGNLSRLVPAIQRELKVAAERRARRDAEDQLKQTERLRQIGETMASLIHDLSSPLQAILGMAEMLKSDQLSNEKRTKYVGGIEQEIEHIIAMRNDFLEFTRGEIQIAPVPINVATLARELTETYGPVYEEAGVTLAFSDSLAEGVTSTILGDQVKLWRVLQNLIANAKDAMPAGGRVSIDVSVAPGGVIVEVADNGRGIPLEIRDKLFTPFVTYGKTNGTGLGLAMVKRTVEAHGGSVSFVTEECVGTTFKLSFPKATPLPSERRTPSSLTSTLAK